MTQNKILHILNGMEMYQRFSVTNFLAPESMIPFNEAMCYGNTCYDLFSDEFTKIRAGVHHVTTEQYTKVTLAPLQPLFHGDFTRVALWFDLDMFYQINLLSILAWLDQTDYVGDIDLHIVDDHDKIIDNFTLKAKGYDALYKQVLLDKQEVQHIEPSPLQKGVKRYLHYLDESSDLMLYIKGHQDSSVKELVPLLLDKFKDYGLGDTLYAEVITSYRQHELGHL